MKLLVLLVFILLFQGEAALCQVPDKAILKFKSSIQKLQVTGNEQLVIATRAGEVAFAPSINDYWKRIDVIEKGRQDILSGLLLDNASFFNTDTGFVSGFINNGKGKYNIIYHTVNQGRNWKAIDFGQDGWVDIATNLDNGEAWLSVSGSGIAYTKDYGFTWRHYSIPEKKQRFTSIYFNTKKQGIIGSLWNMLAITSDNCESWTLLPTPLDQKKYNKTNTINRPEIERVAIFKNYYLVNQEGLIFYSAKDSINWIFLPNYDDFYTDPQSSALFFKTKKSTFIKLDENLQPSLSFADSIFGYAATCRNAGLFIMNGSKILHIKADNTVETQFIYTNNRSDMQPAEFGFCNKGTYGILGNQIYLQTAYNGSWEHQFNLPFSMDSVNISMADTGRILVTKNDSLFYYTISSGKVEKTTRADRKETFLKYGLQKIIFEQGSAGCFHHFSDQVVYENENGSFTTQGMVSQGSQHTATFISSEESIDGELVKKFVRTILLNNPNATTIGDLGFTDKDYQLCKNDIIKFKEAVDKGKAKSTSTAFQFNQNNLDFARLISLVDSVRTIDPVLLSSFLTSLSNLYSTTTNWVKVSFINDNGDKVEIENSFYDPNAFYFPWCIKIDGLYSSNTDIRINNFINLVYPGFLETKNKSDVLHTIVKKLY